jgi:hypothetical protein
VHESEKHGWPSFRDAEIISDRLRVLSDGETVRCVEGKLAFRPRPLPRAPALIAFNSLQSQVGQAPTKVSARRPASDVVSHAASMGRTLVTIFLTRKETDTASTWCVLATLRAPVRICAKIKPGTTDGDPCAGVPRCLEIAIGCALQKICPVRRVIKCGCAGVCSRICAQHTPGHQGAKGNRLERYQSLMQA